jgi:hypothetical protein
MDDKWPLCFKIYAEIEISDTIKTHVDKIFYWKSLLGDDDGEHHARMPQVSLNGDGDGDAVGV